MKKIRTAAGLLVALCLAAAAGCGSPGRAEGDGEEDVQADDNAPQDTAAEDAGEAGDAAGEDLVVEDADDGDQDEPLPPPDLEVYHRRGFDFVLPADTISPDDRVDALSFRAAGGEYEPVSFIVRAGEDLDLTAAAGPLSCDDGGVMHVIDAGRLDLRVVKVWKQRGIGKLVDRPEGIDVPELLVYDDAQELHSDWSFPAENFVEGSDGGGVRLDAAAYLSFPTDGMDLAGGTVAFMFKPDWDCADEPRTRFLLNLRNEFADEIALFYNGSNSSLRLALRGGGVNAVCAADVSWSAGEWHPIAVTWDYTGGPGSGACALYIDGSRASANAGADPVSAMPPAFSFGSIPGGDRAAKGVFDELRVYAYAASREDVEGGSLDDDRLVLDAGFEDAAGTAGLAYEMRAGQMGLPTLAHDLRTAVPAGTLKQFWLTADVDAGTAPCAYSGTVTLTADGRAPFDIPLTLTVLPFDLPPRPAAFHMFYLSFSLDPEDLQFTGEPLMRAYFRDLRAHGVTGIKLRPMGAYVERAMELAWEEGFTTVVVEEPPEQDLINAMTGEPYGYEPYFYGIDEANSAAKLKVHVRKSHEIHEAGALVATALLYQSAERLRDPSNSVYNLVDELTGVSFRDLGWTDEAVDFPNYHITNLTLSDEEQLMDPDDRARDMPLFNYIEAVRAGATPRNPGIVESYYWQPWVQVPGMNRHMAGFFLGASGLDGCWPWGYLAVGFAGNDAFSDDDNPERDSRDFMTVHPSSEGPIPTTQWEALREGVDDLRYLAVLERLLDERAGEMPDRVALIRADAGAMLDAYARTWSMLAIPPARFEEDRARVVDWILELLL